MSSFRPNAETAPPEFVASGFMALADRGLVAPGVGSEGDRFGPAAHPQTPAVSEASVEESIPPEDLARLQAFEEAAFERGVESARQKEERLSQFCDALESAARSVERAATTSVGANRELMLQLAAEIARRWAGAELSLEAGKFGAALDRAIEACGESSGLRLALHPEDLALLEAGEPERVASWQASNALQLVSRPDLERGAFEMDAGSKVIDGRPEAILESLRDALSAALDTPAPSDAEASS